MELIKILLPAILILQFVVIYLELTMLSGFRREYQRWEEGNKNWLEECEADRAEYVKDMKEWEADRAEYVKDKQEWEAGRAENVKDKHEWGEIKESLLRFLDNVERRSHPE
jgi:hypothetical protein